MLFCAVNKWIANVIANATKSMMEQKDERYVAATLYNLAGIHFGISPHMGLFLKCMFIHLLYLVSAIGKIKCIGAHVE